LWRFNPFQKIKFNELDRHIAFSAGLVILTTTILNNYLIRLKSTFLKGGAKLLPLKKVEPNEDNVPFEKV
jgi:hypothetical protein